MITVFTPTYNRAYLLPRLYESLKSQTFKDLEWLIVDDGSTDDTRDLVDKWINKNLLDIRYYYQENGGKHRAINRGAPLAKGEWFFIVDSDDYLPDNSLEIASKWIDTIKDDDSFAGVCGVKKDITEKIDCGFNFEFMDASPLYGTEISRTDKAEIFRTSILKGFPFPDFPGERFCAEGLIWNRIGLHYKLRYFNEVIYCFEYLEDGLSRNSLRHRRQSPTYASLVYKEQVKYKPSWKEKVRAAINYWRFVWFAKVEHTFFDVPCYAYLFLPVGLLFTIRDNYILK